jgi:hypothetical protein
MNPYYDSDKLGLDLLSFDEPGLSYEYNTLCFWVAKDGRVYSASDSGCSCPTPFEQYSGATLDEVLPMLERVGSLAQAESIFDAWNEGVGLGVDERRNLAVWIAANLKA